MNKGESLKGITHTHLCLSTGSLGETSPLSQQSHMQVAHREGEFSNKREHSEGQA